MSFRRFAKRKRTVHNDAAAAAADAAVAGLPPPPPISIEAFALQPVERTVPAKRKRGTLPVPKAIQQQVVLSTPGNYKFAQNPALPQAIVPGASALVTLLGIPPREDGRPAALPLDDYTRDLVSPGSDDGGMEMQVQRNPDPDRHRRRRAAQYATWRDRVIPGLLRPFMEYRRAAQREEQPPAPACDCHAPRSLTVGLADWEGEFTNIAHCQVLTARLAGFTTRRIQYCDCFGAAQHLLALGYFPCAPIRPSLAFSLQLLELVSVHALNVAPNTTAWATTLETFWARRGFVVETRVSRALSFLALD